MSSQNYYIPHDPSFRTLMTCAPELAVAWPGVAHSHRDQCIAQGKEDHPEGSSENAGRSSVELDQGEIGEVETHG